MRPLRSVVLLAASAASLAGIPFAGAQPPRAGAQASVAQAERNSVSLRQGMTVEEVQKLLGKPKRTALKNASNAVSEPWQGTLQWTYFWSPDHILQVVFAAKAPEQWYVNSWDWSSY